MTLYALFKQHVTRTPQRVAVVYQQQTLSYEQLDQQVTALSAYWVSQGLRRADRVALFAPNGLAYPVVLLAVARLGLTVVPLPMSLKGQALHAACNSAKPVAAVAWPSVSRALLDNGLIKPDRLISLERSVAGETTWQSVLTPKVKALSASGALSEIDADIDVDAPYILTMTSGSTGTPKPIVLSQACKIARAKHSTIEYYGLTADDRVLVATPLYHSLAQRGVLMPLILGACAVILPKFSLASWLSAIEQHRISFLFAVSAQLESLLTATVDPQRLRSLRCLVSSSAVLDSHSKQALLSMLNCRFHECYGASEVGVVTDFCISDSPEKNGSVGRALPSVSLVVLGEDGRVLPVGCVGEIACKTPTRFSGYDGLPDITEQAWDAQGFFKTGDLGYLDDEGYLFFVGRQKEVISSGGITIYPQDIEAVIKQHPDVSDCVAFGCADAQLGEYVSVVYEQRSDQDITRSLRLLCLQELTDYQQPRELISVSALARNPMGKVLRHSVKTRYQPSSA